VRLSTRVSLVGISEQVHPGVSAREMKSPVLAALAGITLLAGHACSAVADDVYNGKTINVYIGSAPGAGYDVYSRLVVRHIGKYIPGQPRLIPHNMPGASSRTAAAYLYNVASKDGLSLGVINQELPLAETLGEKLLFETAKFAWIGSPDTNVRVVVTWHSTGVKSIEEAKKKEVTMGASGPIEASGYPEMMNTLLGTKFRSIRGYTGGAAINLAMEKGEVDGRGDNAWSSWKGDHPDWVQDRKINVLVQVGLAKAPDLPDVPLLMDLANNPEEREALKLISTPGSMGHPLIAPPGVSADKIQILRRAFNATMTDPAFLDDAKRQRRPIDPVRGEELQKIAQELLSAPQSIKDRANALTRSK
jgi:tripartite-type tricarboxylate transporter receptor subunit TctC